MTTTDTNTPKIAAISERKLAANRANTKKSTGPKTPRGKQIAALNAVTHGITARTLALSTEDRDALRRHMAAYLDLYQPANQVETDLVAILISASWRLRRAWRLEHSLFERQMVDDRPALEAAYTAPDPHTRTGAAFKSLSDTSASLFNLDRYENRLTRAYRAALNDLHRHKLQIEPTRRPVLNILDEEPNPPQAAEATPEPAAS